MPSARLSFEDSTIIDNPSDADIADSIASLNLDGNSFAILELTESTYMQTGLQSGGEYVIEYQQGSLQEHFQAFTADADKVIKALQAYAIESDSWQSMFEWQQVEL